MNQDDLQSIAGKIQTQWVSISDALRQLAEANSLSLDEAANVFVDFGLQSLRPIRLLGDFGSEVQRKSDQGFDEFLIYWLDGKRRADLSEQEFGDVLHFDMTYDRAEWSIPVLIDWCSKRKLYVPTAWSEWMQSVYPNLLERGLVPKSTSWNPQTDDSIRKPHALTETAKPGPTNRFVLTGDHWSITYQGETQTFNNTMGLRYIAYLVQHQGQEIPASDLYYAINPPEPGTADPVYSLMSEAQLGEMGLSVGDLGHAGDALTPEARKRLEAEVLKIQDRIDDAIELGDHEKQAKLELQQEEIARHITTQSGLGGGPRKASSNSERIRKAVSKCIHRDIKKITKTFPDLGRHLKQTITTGTWCRYYPHPRVEWFLIRHSHPRP